MRIWNPGNCTLFQHLAGVIVSDVSHTATSVENRTTMAPPDNPGGDRWPPDPADDAPDQERTAEWKSEQRRLLEHLDGIDPELAVHNAPETASSAFVVPKVIDSESR